MYAAASPGPREASAIAAAAERATPRRTPPRSLYSSNISSPGRSPMPYQSPLRSPAASSRRQSSIPYESPIRQHSRITGSLGSGGGVSPYRPPAPAAAPAPASSGAVSAYSANKYLPAPSPRSARRAQHGTPLRLATAKPSGSTRVREASSQAETRLRLRMDAVGAHDAAQKLAEQVRGEALVNQITGQTGGPEAAAQDDGASYPQVVEDYQQRQGEGARGAAVAAMGTPSPQGGRYLEGASSIPARADGPYYSPLRRTLSPAVATALPTTAVDDYLASPPASPAPKPLGLAEPAADAPSAPAARRETWVVAMDSAREASSLDAGAKADRLLALQKRGWEQSKSLSQAIAGPTAANPEPEPEPEDAFGKLSETDQKAVTMLGWTQASFNLGRGPPDVAWAEMDETRRTMAMMLGFDGEAWDKAVEEEREEEEHRAFEKSLGDPAARQALAAKEVELFIMEMTNGLGRLEAGEATP